MSEEAATFNFMIPMLLVSGVYAGVIFFQFVTFDVLHRKRCCLETSRVRLATYRH